MSIDSLEPEQNTLSEVNEFDSCTYEFDDASLLLRLCSFVWLCSLTTVGYSVGWSRFSIRKGELQDDLCCLKSRPFLLRMQLLL